MDHFNAEGFSCRRSDSLFELKKYCNEEKPALIFAVNNLKEKKSLKCYTACKRRRKQLVFR